MDKLRRQNGRQPRFTVSVHGLWLFCFMEVQMGWAAVGSDILGLYGMEIVWYGNPCDEV